MDIMVDIETLGSREDACILSIGAVAFTNKIEETFLTNIDIKSNFDNGRTVDASNLNFWLKASKEAQKKLYDPPPSPLYNAMNSFLDFMNTNLKSKSGVWANGITFDLSILRGAFNSVDIEVPWHYKQECCMRPIRYLSSIVGLRYHDYKERTNSVIHNALDDAKLQAQFIIDFKNRLNK